MVVTYKNIILFCACVYMALLSGCNATVPVTAPKEDANINAIHHLTFNLPQQLQWKKITHQVDQSGAEFAQWIVNGFEQSNTPARIIYQKIIPATPNNAVLAQFMQPYQKSCTDVSVIAVNTQSTYQPKNSLELICAQMGNNHYGSAFYISVFSDANASHVVLSDLRTLPSEKAGVLTFKTDQEKQQVQTISALMQIMAGFINTIRACDATDRCI